LIDQTVVNPKSKEHAIWLWEHEENPGKIEFNREPE